MIIHVSSRQDAGSQMVARQARNRFVQKWTVTFNHLNMILKGHVKWHLRHVGPEYKQVPHLTILLSMWRLNQSAPVSKAENVNHFHVYIKSMERHRYPNLFTLSPPTDNTTRDGAFANAFLGLPPLWPSLNPSRCTFPAAQRDCERQEAGPSAPAMLHTKLLPPGYD